MTTELKFSSLLEESKDWTRIFIPTKKGTFVYIGRSHKVDKILNVSFKKVYGECKDNQAGSGIKQPPRSKLQNEKYFELPSNCYFPSIFHTEKENI